MVKVFWCGGIVMILGMMLLGEKVGLLVMDLFVGKWL